MTVSLTHTFVSAVPDVGDPTLVEPSNWNDQHVLTLATSRLLGRTTSGIGTAEEISATAPIVLSAGALSMPAATSLVDGYLSHIDWTTFNAKGAGTVTSVAALTLGTTGTDLTSSVANGTTTPSITLNVPTASASNRGALSAADWSTFNAKGSGTVTTTGSPVTGNLAKFSGSASVTNGDLSGDITTSGALAATLATVNTNVGSFGSSTQASTFTVNGKGLLTAAGNVTVTPTVGSLTGLGTGVATALGVNVGTAGAFVVNGGALGAPSSGVATSLTGLPLSTGVTGTLPVANGGTGQTAYTDGQLLIGNTATGLLSKATLTAGTNITITNGNGSISIAATGGGSGVPVGTQTGANALAVGTGSTANGASAVATGSSSIANGGNAVAYGISSNATGANTLAVGTSAIANASIATAVGDFSNATGFNATALGYGALASAANATSAGTSADAAGANATAVGAASVTTGVNATAIGQASTAAFNSVAAGQLATAGGTNAVAVGVSSNASFANSTAVGVGSATTAINQVRLGRSTETVSIPGTLSVAGVASLLSTATALTNNAAAQIATMTNGPTAGNPTKWFAINDAGTTRFIPAW